MIMKTGCFGILLALASVLPSWAQLEVPPRFNYQGVLRDGTGGVLGEQTPTIHFKLYKESSGGSAVWTGDQKVLLDTNGLFNVTLSDQMSGSMGDDVTLGGVIASNATLFMGITVDENTEISPRQELLSVPFALRAGDVNQASSGFTVNGGSLIANSGAEIAGELQTTKIQMGSNTLSVAGGAADLKLTGNLDVTDQLHVMNNVKVDGMATASNLTVMGKTKIFSRQYTSANAWSNTWTGTRSSPHTTAPADQTILVNAPSDGFVIFNLSYYLYTNTGGDSHRVAYTVSIGKGVGDTNKRTFDQGFYVEDCDMYSTIRNDVATFPVLEGESVTLHFTYMQLKPSDSGQTTTVALTCVYTPFGQTIPCSTTL